MTFLISATPNHQGFQSLGTIKGFYKPTTAAHVGEIESSHGKFSAFIHAKCRKKLLAVCEKTELYFLVWLRFIKNQPRLTVVGFGTEGVDNNFFVSGCLSSRKNESLWTPQTRWIDGNRYEFIVTRNPNPSKKKQKREKPFKISAFSAATLPANYFQKLSAIECKFVEGVLHITNHKFLSDTLPDDSVLNKPKKKQYKPLIKKKIPVGVIEQRTAGAIEQKPVEMPKKKPRN